MKYPDDFINKVICGDCLEVMKQIPDKSIDLVLTDPPYNTGMTADSSSTWLTNFFDDNYTDENYLKLIKGSISEMYRVLKDDTAVYIFMNWKKLGLWMDELIGGGFKVKNIIVWDKVVHGLNYMNYAYTHEFIIFAVKGNYLPKNKNGDEFYKDVWHIKRDMGKKLDNNEHETAKTMSVVQVPILHGSKEGDLILDPFLGSGTTAVAAKSLHRNFIGIEISQKYCDISNDRLRACNPLL